MKKKRFISASALIEFLFVIPLFISLVAGLIEISVLLYDKTIITHASREGARYGVVIRTGGYASLAEVQSHTTNYCANKLISFGGSPGVGVSAFVPSGNDPAFGDVLSVTVNYQFNGLIQQHSLTATTVMSYE